MKYEELIKAFALRPFFETVDLLTLFDEPELQIMAGLSRWVSEKKIIQLKREKYILPELYQKKAAHIFYMSNFIYSPSYITFYSALQHYRMIMEHVLHIQAITTKQTASWNTSLGIFSFSSTKQNRFFGYDKISLGDGIQDSAFIATPEKALIDICLSQAGDWTEKRWSELRLQNTNLLNHNVFNNYLNQLKSPKANRSIRALNSFLERDL